VAHGEIRDQSAGAAYGDERAAAERDQLVEPAGCERRTDTGLRDRYPPAVEIHLEDRVRPHLGDEPSDLTASEGLDERGDGVPEEAQHDVLGQVELLDREMRFEHRVARRVEVEDRGVIRVGHGRCSVVRWRWAPRCWAEGRRSARAPRLPKLEPLGIRGIWNHHAQELQATPPVTP